MSRHQCRGCTASGWERQMGNSPGDPQRHANEAGALQFVLSAPFRTNIEMDTFSVLSDEAVDDHIDAIAAALNDAEGCAGRWATGSEGASAGELRFANLDEHSLPRSASPIIRLQVAEHVAGRFAAGAALPDGASSLRITDCAVGYYDDTIGLLVCRVSIGGSPAAILEGFDSWSTRFCKSVIDALASCREELEQALVGTAGATKHHRRLFSNPAHLRRFSDRNRDSREDGQTMLWVNRVLVADSCPEHELIDGWTQTLTSNADWLPLGSMSLLACVGNSVLAGPHSERDVSVIVDVIAISTFFYVSRDLFRHHLKLMLLDVGRAAKGVARASFTEEALGDLRTHVDAMEGECEDCRLGLQGHRNAALDRILRVWEYDSLSAAVKRKSASLGSAWALLQASRRRKYDAVVQAVLSVIAGAAVMNLILSLFAASNATIPEDSVWGLLDAAQLISPDLTLYGALIVVLLLPILVIRGR